MTITPPQPYIDELAHDSARARRALPATPRLLETVQAARPARHAADQPWWIEYRRYLRTSDIAIVAVSVLGALVPTIVSAFSATALTASALPGAALASSATGAYAPLAPERIALNSWIALGIALTWLVSLSIFRTHSASEIGTGPIEYKRVANATMFAFGMLAMVLLIARFDITTGFALVAFPLGGSALLVSRWSWRQWLTKQRIANKFQSRTLVVGDLHDVEYVVDTIEGKPGSAFELVGVAINRARHVARTASSTGIPVVSDLDGVKDSVRDLDVKTVIVAGRPRGSGDYVKTLAWSLEGTSAELILASRLTDVAGPRIHFRPVEGLPLIHVDIPHFEGGRHALKRVLDVVLSGTALVVLSPLLVAIGLAIRMDSHGGALFSQERVGRGGSTFRILKFRSMVQDAEAKRAELAALNEGAGVLFKIRNDPRVTRVGRVLRKYSLDELPQLWNVFVGDMSLVGPRPPLRDEVDEYQRHVHRRLYIKPGLTGMWQVNGRSDLSWDESVRLDLYYVENWSLMGDLVILWRTFRVLLHPSGAY